jgi:two-component system KDP operon response regulator KdpE
MATVEDHSSTTGEGGGEKKSAGANLLVRILVVDDETPIRRLLRVGFGAQGYEVIEAANGKEALAAAETNPDLMVLDLGLPDMGGLEVLRSLQERGSAIPVIVLSSWGDENRKLQAFDLGAYDYVTKPFGMSELLARMRTALRHRLQVQGERSFFQVAGLSVDLVRRIVQVGGVNVNLSPKEYELLRVLIQHAGRVLTHSFLLKTVWEQTTDPQHLRFYIRQIRQKIEPVAEKPFYILTETGVGYRLRGPHE